MDAGNSVGFLCQDTKMLSGFGWVDKFVVWWWRSRWRRGFCCRSTMTQFRVWRLLQMQENKVYDRDAGVAIGCRVSR